MSANKKPISTALVTVLGKLAKEDTYFSKFLDLFWPETPTVADYNKLIPIYETLLRYAIEPINAGKKQRISLELIYSEYPDIVLDFLCYVRSKEQCSSNNQHPVQKFILRYALSGNSVDSKGRKIGDLQDGEVALLFERETGDTVSTDAVKKARQRLRSGNADQMKNLTRTAGELVNFNLRNSQIIQLTKEVSRMDQIGRRRQRNSRPQD